MLWKEGCTNEIECSPWYGHMVEKGTTFFSASNEQLATKSCPRVAWVLILVLHSYHLASSIPINSNPFQLARAYEKIPRDFWEFLRALLNSSIWEREIMFLQWIFAILSYLSLLPFPCHERRFSKHSMSPLSDLSSSGWCWESLKSNTIIPRELSGLLLATQHAYSGD